MCVCVCVRSGPKESKVCVVCDGGGDTAVADINFCCEMSRIDATNIFMVRGDARDAAHRNLDRNQICSLHKKHISYRNTFSVLKLFFIMTKLSRFSQPRSTMISNTFFQGEKLCCFQKPI